MVNVRVLLLILKILTNCRVSGLESLFYSIECLTADERLLETAILSCRDIACFCLFFTQEMS